MVATKEFFAEDHYVDGIASEDLAMSELRLLALRHCEVLRSNPFLSLNKFQKKFYK